MIIVAYVLIVVFLVMEGRLRQGREAKSLDAGEHDWGSTKRIGAAFAVTFILLIVAPILNYFQIAVMGSIVLGIVGLALMVVGLALRI